MNNIPAIISTMKADMYRNMKWEYSRISQAFEPEYILNSENECALLTMALNPTHLQELLKHYPLYIPNPDLAAAAMPQQTPQ